MSTKSMFEREEIGLGHIAFSPSRTTIETAFYGNNVRKVLDLKEAYRMAKASSGTIALDLPVYKPKRSACRRCTNSFFNDGETVGRFAGARIILVKRES